MSVFVKFNNLKCVIFIVDLNCRRNLIAHNNEKQLI